MKVFKFYADSYYYAYSGETEEEAKDQLFEDNGQMQIDSVEEIPESEWDEEKIKMWEDNDTTRKPFMVSIRDILSDDPGMIFTNDHSTF